MTRLILVRHGRSQANEQRIFANHENTYPLTEAGETQAEIAAARLSRYPVDRVYSSPILRAMQTARPIARAHGLRVYKASALVEYSVGIYEGQPYAAGIEQKWALEAEWVKGRSRDQSLPGGETFLDIYQRYVPFVRGLVDNPDNANKVIVLVGHGSISQLMIPQIASNVSYDFIKSHPLYNTSIVILDSQPDGWLRCTQWLHDPDNAHSGEPV